MNVTAWEQQEVLLILTKQ
jgi:hypothetical protein